MSLLEAVIAVYLLSFVALSVLSLTQTGFVAQRRNMEIARANLAAQAAIADLRVWAADITNYQGDWGRYSSSFQMDDFPDYEIRVRSAPSGRQIHSPCSEMESQWELTPRGMRTMPRAVIPVEITVSWSPQPIDSMTVLTYVGEPKRDVSQVQFEVVGPSRRSLSMNSRSNYSVIARDGQGRPLDNLMFQWIPDLRYLSASPDSARDGRSFELLRDQLIAPPDVPPPAPPRLSPVTCYARYAGEYLNVTVPGVELP